MPYPGPPKSASSSGGETMESSKGEILIAPPALGHLQAAPYLGFVVIYPSPSCSGSLTQWHCLVGWIPAFAPCTYLPGSCQWIQIRSLRCSLRAHSLTSPSQCPSSVGQSIAADDQPQYLNFNPAGRPPSQVHLLPLPRLNLHHCHHTPR